MRNTASGRLYAVKRIDLKQCDGEGVSVKAVETWAETLEKSCHPNLVRNFLSYTEPMMREFYIVSELVEGGSLADQIDQHTADGPTVRRWLTEIMSALLYLHDEMGLLHRTLSPSNILLSEGGVIKITELGMLFKIKTNMELVRASSDTSLYFSSDRCSGGSYDGRDDVWAVGCIMLELLSGTRLEYSLRDAVALEEFIEICRPLCSVDLFDIILRTLRIGQHERARSSEVFRLLVVSSYSVDGPSAPVPEPAEFIPDGDGMADLYVQARYCGNETSFADLLRLVRLREILALGFWSVLEHEEDVLLHLAHSLKDSVRINPREVWESLRLEESDDADIGYRNLLMGKFCEFGLIGTADGVAAFRHYKKAAYEGHSDAQYSLGRCYSSGFGVAKSAETATKYYKIAANQSHLQAIHALAQCLQVGCGVSRDPAAAFRLFTQAAQRGHIDALYQAGCCCGTGMGTRWDTEKSLEYCLEAAEKGHLDAQYYVGVCFMQGIGTVLDRARGAEYWELSAAEGNTTAMNALVEWYSAESEPQSDVVKAARWAVAARGPTPIQRPPSVVPSPFMPPGSDVIDQTDAHSAGDIGGEDGVEVGLGDSIRSPPDFSGVSSYRPPVDSSACGDADPPTPSPVTDASGHFSPAHSNHVYGGLMGESQQPPVKMHPFVDVNMSEKMHAKAAFDCFKAGAVSSNPNCGSSMYELGKCYQFGKGVVANGKEAVRYYQLAVANDIPEAQYMLANCYHDGVGGPQRRKEAFKLYKAGAERGDPDSQHVLGMYFLQGLGGVHKAPAKGFRLTKVAADANNEYALHSLAQCYLQGDGVEKDIHQAAAYAKKAADMGNTSSQSLLGYIYGELGDIQLSIKYYQMAVDAGSADAMNNLGLYYEEGRGLPVNFTKAIHYFKLAKQHGALNADINLGRAHDKLSRG